MGKEYLINLLKEKGFSEEILKAFKKSDRKKFIPKEFRDNTYLDIPIRIGYGQTTSQPYVIAFMLDILDVKDKQKILEVGSGGGYVLDLLSNIAPKGKIFGIERIKALADSSAKLLANKKNVKVIYEDGSEGLESESPFDRIIVSAECKSIPKNLIHQLKTKGILVVPVKNSIILIKRDNGISKIKEYPGFIFVPFIEDKSKRR